MITLHLANHVVAVGATVGGFGGFGGTVSGIRRQAGTVVGAYRRGGVGGVVVALAGRLPAWMLRIEWYSVWETITPGSGGPPRLWSMTRAGHDDVEALAAIRGGSPDAVRARLDAGDRAYVAVAGDAPVAHVWYRSGRWREDDIEFVLSDRERWGYDSFVLPSHRGARIAPALASFALEDLNADGVFRVVSVIDTLNEASAHAARRYGGYAISSFVTIAALGLEVVHERPVDAARGSLRVHRLSRPIVRPAPASPLPC